MRLSSFWCLLVVLGAGAVCHAQQAPAQSPSPSPQAPAEPAPTEAPVEAPPAGAADAGVPSVEPVSPPVEPESPAAGEPLTAEPPPAASEPAMPPPSPPSAAAGVQVPQGTEAIPSPGELGDRLVGDLSPESQVKPTWTAPAPVLTLHGYLRVRGELMDSFWLGRTPHSVLLRRDTQSPELNEEGLGPDPFSRFRPLERTSDGATYCADEDRPTDGSLYDETVCGVDTLQHANIRFRFSPQLNVSEDVRVKATFDVLDNVILGDGPEDFYGRGAAGDDVFTGTNVSRQAIVARRAWAEVRNRDLGELRFGVMPEHWGLGMLYNAGNRLDDDFSTDLGRVMGITKIAGFYLSAAYDFMSEGAAASLGEFRPDYDLSQLDDLDQFTFSVVRRVPDEDEDAVLERGDLVLNGGVHFQLRNQDARLTTSGNTRALSRLSATLYTPDIWGQLRIGGLRLELEAAGVFGSLWNGDGDDGRTLDVAQLGVVFESELRLLEDKLGLYLYGGFASGDSDVEGLSSGTDFVTQGTNDDVVSTFRFHPSYRVDTILWRNIMRQVTGAYYFRPGVSYDFVKDDFGQLFGARLDVIWSRATSFLQAPGNDPNLGIELNAQLYWRSDDGPDQDDGYHASLQYGVLFPLDGLGYYHRSTNLDTAQSLRIILGVVY